MVKLKMKFNKRNSNISKDVISKVVFIFEKFRKKFYALCLCGILVWLNNSMMIELN